MATLEIALPDSSTPHSIQSVSLEGRTYIFTFNWNSRADRWAFSIDTQDGTPVISGALLQVGPIDMLRTVPNTLDHVPPGQLYLGGPDDPTLDTISRCALFYVESE